MPNSSATGQMSTAIVQNVDNDRIAEPSRIPARAAELVACAALHPFAIVVAKSGVQRPRTLLTFLIPANSLN